MSYDTFWAWWSVAWLIALEALMIPEDGWNGVWMSFVLWGFLNLLFTWMIGPKDWWKNGARNFIPEGQPTFQAFEDEGVPARRGHPDLSRPSEDDYAGITTVRHQGG